MVSNFFIHVLDRYKENVFPGMPVQFICKRLCDSIHFSFVNMHGGLAALGICVIGVPVD